MVKSPWCQTRGRERWSAKPTPDSQNTLSRKTLDSWIFWFVRSLSPIRAQIQLMKDSYSEERAETSDTVAQCYSFSSFTDKHLISCIALLYRPAFHVTFYGFAVIISYTVVRHLLTYLLSVRAKLRKLFRFGGWKTHFNYKPRNCK